MQNYYKKPACTFKRPQTYTGNRVIHRRQCVVYCGFEGQRADRRQAVANKKKMLYCETTLNAAMSLLAMPLREGQRSFIVRSNRRMFPEAFNVCGRDVV